MTNGTLDQSSRSSLLPRQRASGRSTSHRAKPARPRLATRTFIHAVTIHDKGEWPVQVQTGLKFEAVITNGRPRCK